MAPKPDWNFLGGFASKPSLEDEEADDVLEELRGVEVDDIADDNLRLAFKLAKTVMTVCFVESYHFRMIITNHYRIISEFFVKDTILQLMTIVRKTPYTIST